MRKAPYPRIASTCKPAPQEVISMQFESTVTLANGTAMYAVTPGKYINRAN